MVVKRCAITLGTTRFRAFGDGRFQLINIHDRDGGEYIALHDSQAMRPVLDKVDVWEVDGALIYALGDGGKCESLLNYRTGACEVHAKIANVPKEHRVGFDRLVEKLNPEFR